MRENGTNGPPAPPLSASHEYLYHYTSKSGLRGILRSQTLYATDYRYLNDRTEVQQLRNYLLHIANRVARTVISERIQENSRFGKIVLQSGGCDALADEEAVKIVDVLYEATFGTLSKRKQAHARPFLVSFCSHVENEYAQQNGLLSQWRAYGKEAGFCLVFDTKKLEDLLSDEFSRYAAFGSLADVVYEHEEVRANDEFNKLRLIFEKVLNQLWTGRDYEDIEVGDLLGPLVTSACQFKHRAFSEECEVRIIVTPL